MADLDESGGYLHLLPMQGTDLTATSISVAVLPWGSPSYLGVIGHHPGDAGTTILEIAYEWPTSWLRTTTPLTQFELEWLHAHRFRTDHVLGLRRQPFSTVQEGANPPDLVARGSEGPTALECTRLAIAARQAAHGLFRAVKQRILRIGPEFFPALSGHIVYLWFNDTDSALNLPFRSSDDAAAVELVKALAEYRPDTNNLWVPGGELPDPAPQLPIHATSAGASFYCLPLVGSVPDSVLFNTGGFEVGLAYTTVHDLSEEAAHLRQRILEKDHEGSDWLLLSAGAPDKLGATYPAEEPLAHLLFENDLLQVEPEHLRRITLHFWSSGLAVDLWPEKQVVFGPLYQDAVAALRQIRIPDS